MKANMWQIPPPLHKKDLFGGLSMGEWGIFGVISLFIFLVFVQPAGLAGLPYLAIPAVIYVLLRRVDTDHGYINALEMLWRYLRYFWQYGTGSDTFILEKEVRNRYGSKETTVE